MRPFLHFLCKDQEPDPSSRTISYTEAVALTKALSDNAWQAAALEALVQATVMQMVLKAQENAPVRAHLSCRLDDSDV